MAWSGLRALKATRNIVRTVTVVTMGTAVIVATADGFAQSYAGLYNWGIDHRLTGWKADSFPLLIDLFVLVGELGLFLLAIDGHKVRKSWLSWVDLLIPASVAVAGWGVSLWFNIGHVRSIDGVPVSFDDKVTAGVPPVAAMIGLVVLLRTLHRYMAQLDKVPAADVPASNGALRTVVARAGTPVAANQLVSWTAPHTPIINRDELFKARTAEPVPAPDVPAEWAAPWLKPIPWDEYKARADEAKQDASEPVPVPEAAPEIVLHVDETHVPARTAEPVPADSERAEAALAEAGKYAKHELWERGVQLYRASRMGGNAGLSQRALTHEMRPGMTNRELAAAIIKYVKTLEP
jgi:hypothetical protein